jgi:2,4-dienoyl-CoA reductase-like NADH-dependent reductase (Old Yellow Enzyme family)
VGRVSHYSVQPDNGLPIGPSDKLDQHVVCFAYDDAGNPANVPVSRPRAMDESDIKLVRDEFVQAAINARESGMDGVEIHGANGYLFDQFLNSIVNTRTDHYGGSVENRCRLLLETVDAVIDAIGADMTGVRISPNGRYNAMPEDPEMEATFIDLAEELARRKIVYLHVNDQSSFGLPAIPESLLAKIRSVFPGTMILCGGYDARRAQDAIDSGIADLVAFGASYLANPDLPARLEHGWPLNEADQSSFYGGGEEGYTDYPAHDPE